MDRSPCCSGAVLDDCLLNRQLIRPSPSWVGNPPQVCAYLRNIDGPGLRVLASWISRVEWPKLSDGEEPAGTSRPRHVQNLNAGTCEAERDRTFRRGIAERQLRAC